MFGVGRCLTWGQRKFRVPTDNPWSAYRVGIAGIIKATWLRRKPWREAFTEAEIDILDL